MQQQIVVHLVHGTWPRGLMSSRSVPAPWFHPASEFCMDLASRLNGSVTVRSFEWSGKNSFSERAKASAEFAEHLRQHWSLDKTAKHVVVSHSHGGNVCANALGALVGHPCIANVSELICISTPFTNWVPASVAHSRLFFLALSSVVVSAGLAVAVAISAEMLSFHWLLIMAASLIFGIMLAVILYKLFKRIILVDYSQTSSIPNEVNVLILRAPRDEASLAIGLTQLLHGVAGFVFDVAGAGPDIWSRGKVAFAAVLMPFSVGAGHLLLQLIAPEVGEFWWRFAISISLAEGILGAIYLSCVALAALAVGYRRVSLWPWRSLEVEVAPPLRTCAIRVFQEAAQESRKGFRHGAHGWRSVREEIASVIQCVGSQERKFEKRGSECTLPTST